MKRLLFILLMLMTQSVWSDDRSGRTIPDAGTVRERFLKLIDRPRVPLNAIERPSGQRAGLIQTAFEFDSEVGQRVPGILLKQKKGKSERVPVVIVLHGTGGSKQNMLPLLQQFAQRGVIAVAIDGRHFGERAGNINGSAAYQAAILETWKSGRGLPFFYDTVWDLLRLIDYLETRPDVDATRIGAIGFSKGGIELYLAAAVDVRLAAAVPCIGVQSFGWAVENDAWYSRISTIQNAVDLAAADAGVSKVDAAFVRRFYQRVVPGIDREFDGPVMLPLIAPRPFLMINGETDDRTPLPGLKLCIDPTVAAYEKAGARSRFEVIVQPNTGHAVRPEVEQQAVKWLVQQLTAPLASK